MEKPPPRRLLEWSLRAQDLRAEWARKLQGWHRSAEQQLAAWHRTAEAELTASDPAAAVIFRAQNLQAERDLAARHHQAEQPSPMAEGSVRFVLQSLDDELEPPRPDQPRPPAKATMPWSSHGKA